MAKKKLFSEIVVVMDKSSSMYHLTNDTIGGFNQFLNEQKKVDGKANVTLVQFDSSYHFVHKGVNIQDVPDLNDKTYIAGGTTALLDAVGRGIIETEGRIKKMRRKPDQVIFMIITDGYENSSREFQRDQIAKMVKDKQDVEKWDFMFVGANIDSFGEAGSFGMSLDTTADYSTSKTKGVYAMMSKKISGYRSTGEVETLHFSAEERNELKDDKEDNS